MNSLLLLYILCLSGVDLSENNQKEASPENLQEYHKGLPAAQKSRTEKEKKPKILLTVHDFGIDRDAFNEAISACGFPRPSATTIYDDFVSGITYSNISSTRELAMFLAQVLHESNGLQNLEEVRCMNHGCLGEYDSSRFGGHQYYGRGYMQLSWRINYRAASLAIYKDLRLLEKPWLVAQDDRIAWLTAFWYWKTNVHWMKGISSGQFGISTRAINGRLECDQFCPASAQRFQYYAIIFHTWNLPGTANAAGC
jgi:chitinase